MCPGFLVLGGPVMFSFSWKPGRKGVKDTAGATGAGNLSWQKKKREQFRKGKNCSFIILFGFKLEALSSFKVLMLAGNL